MKLLKKNYKCRLQKILAFIDKKLKVYKTKKESSYFQTNFT